MSIKDDDHSAPRPEHNGAGSSVAFGRQSEHVDGLRADVAKLVELEQAERQIAAQRIEILARIDHRALLESGLEPSLGVASNPRDTMAHRAARAEVATALRMSEQTVDRQLVRAGTLVTLYAATVKALGDGKIGALHATVVLEAGEVIGQYGFEDTPEITERRAQYEARVIAHAVRMHPNQLRPKAKRIAEEYALIDLDTRHEIAKARRKVWVRPVEDGMAELCAYLPAHEALAVYSRLTRMAKAVQTAERKPADAASVEGSGTDSATDGAAGVDADPATSAVSRWRARDEIRADLLTDLLLHGTGDTATGGPGTGISGIVQVVTHDQHLLEHGVKRGEKHEQAQTRMRQARRLRAPRPELVGYGPFPVSAARNIVGGGRNAQIVPWDLVTASPTTGDVLRVDRYRPSEEMRRFLAARDLQCRFPGCRTAAHRCEIDHTVDAALGGETSTANTGHLCVGHHKLKHHSGWDVQQHEFGVYEWTSPTGCTYEEEPESRVRFVEMVDPARNEAGRQQASASQGTALSEAGKQPPEDLIETPF